MHPQFLCAKEDCGLFSETSISSDRIKSLTFSDFDRAQTIMKARLKGAQTGRNLLKKKSDALTLRFRQILKKIIEVRSFVLLYS